MGRPYSKNDITVYINGEQIHHLLDIEVSQKNKAEEEEGLTLSPRAHRITLTFALFTGGTTLAHTTLNNFSLHIDTPFTSATFTACQTEGYIMKINGEKATLTLTVASNTRQDVYR